MITSIQSALEPSPSTFLSWLVVTGAILFRKRREPEKSLSSQVKRLEGAYRSVNDQLQSAHVTNGHFERSDGEKQLALEGRDKRIAELERQVKSLSFRNMELERRLKSRR